MFDKFTLMSFVFLGVVFFGAGYDFASVNYQSKIKDIELKSQEALNAGLKEQLEKEREYHNAVTQSQNGFDLSTTAISNKFDSLYGVKLFDSYEWLSDSASDSGVKTLPDSSSNSSEAATETSGRCLTDYSGELSRVQKLYEKELRKAKECDLRTAQLNSLIDLVSVLTSNKEK